MGGLKIIYLLKFFLIIFSLFNLAFIYISSLSLIFIPFVFSFTLAELNCINFTFFTSKFFTKFLSMLVKLFIASWLFKDNFF